MSETTMTVPSTGGAGSRAARGVRGFFAAWRLVLRITAANFGGRLQYRGDFLTVLAMGLAWQTSVFVFVTVVLGRFHGLGGWSSSDILLILAIRLLAHAVVVTVFNSLMLTPYIAQQGLIDFYLVRPMPVYRQVLLYQFPLNAMGDCFAAIVLFTIAVARLHLHWTPASVAYLIAALIGGALLEGAVLTLVSILTFRHTIGISVFMWFDRMIGTFGNYPFTILPFAARAVLTYLLPVAFVAYLPAAVLTGRIAATGVPAWLAYASPAAGPLLYVAARFAWHRALRRYESGSS